MSDILKPLIFISHKHCDRGIADVLRNFIYQNTAGHIDVFQSSSPCARGPRPGAALNRELVDQLWRSNLLLLVYTDSDKDWGYCMWEAGVALKPESPDTNIIVLQCGKDRPQVFQDRVGINMRKREEVQRFVNEFLTGSEFIPRLGEPASGFTPHSDQITRIANAFFQELSSVLPAEENISEEWPACPYMQLSLDLCECDPAKLRQLPDNERVALVREHCLVIDADMYCAYLFGYPQFPRQLRFHDLVREWEDRFRHEAAWADSLSSQLTAAAMWQFPEISWKCMEGNDNYLYAPVLTRVRRMPLKKCMEFDVYFDKFDSSPESRILLGFDLQTIPHRVEMRH